RAFFTSTSSDAYTSTNTPPNSKSIVAVAWTFTGIGRPRCANCGCSRVTFACDPVMYALALSNRPIAFLLLLRSNLAQTFRIGVGGWRQTGSVCCSRRLRLARSRLLRRLRRLDEQIDAAELAAAPDLHPGQPLGAHRVDD